MTNFQGYLDGHAVSVRGRLGAFFGILFNSFFFHFAPDRQDDL